jgi:hypothetical protein
MIFCASPRETSHSFGFVAENCIMKGRDSAMLPVVCVEADVDIYFPVDKNLDDTSFSDDSSNFQHRTAGCITYHVI